MPYIRTMNKQEVIRVRVRDLEIGDVCAGSGQTITHRPYTSVRLNARKRWVEGTYKNGQPFISPWNADTLITVLRSS